MNGGPVDRGRRAFFSRVLRENLVKPLAETRRELAEAVRLEEDQRVYESELLAFGPDVLADTALRSGIATGDADCARVAKALAQRMEEDRPEEEGRGPKAMPASAEEHFRAKIGGMIAQGFAMDSVRECLDLKGVSEVWGGPEADVCPAWYVWLSISPGAYRLRLEHAEVGGDTGDQVLRGLLSIKYFPAPAEPAFRRFSQREQSLIQGPLFDDTHTPTFDGQDEIPESLFQVASIEFVDDVPRGRACLTYSSLDRMRYIHRPADPDAAVTSRELPAWDLGHALFDAFVGLHSFLTRTAPRRIILSRQPGFEFVELEGGNVECRDARDRIFKSLLVACAPGGDGAGSPVEDRMCSDHLTEPWTPLLDTEAQCDCAGDCSPNHHDHQHRHTLRRLKLGDATWQIPLAFNEHWWRLASAEQVANTMPCGCH